MDINDKGVKDDVESPKVDVVSNGESDDGEDESQSLLLVTKKVKWLDWNGDKLAEILEFQPSCSRAKNVYKP
ncbi:hypothetical protein ACJIZ3_013706 [Penstemon smallii]|uniref:Uncharacterized protein n=1 Tax=Penstemon smallii TaxID=265156 RepID=A0ABD3RHV6_9LAMI